MGYDLWWAEQPSREQIVAFGNENPGYFRLNIWGMAATQAAMGERAMFGLAIANSELEPSDEPESDALLTFNLATYLPIFPTPEEFGLEAEPEEFDENGEWIEYPEESAEGQFRKATKEAHTQDTGGPIPFYKLMSNDGWLVTPDEIRRSLELYALRAGGATDGQRFSAGTATVPILADPIKASGGSERTVISATRVAGADLPSVHCFFQDEPIEVTWWAEWIAWIEEAAKHGGFYVW